MSNNRERLSAFEECRLIVLIDRKIVNIKETLYETTDDYLTEIYNRDIRELTEINVKLRG
jgi:hypothetical protein